jgi:hypothetical protein
MPSNSMALRDAKSFSWLKITASMRWRCSAQRRPLYDNRAATLRYSSLIEDPRDADWITASGFV